jgi:hypothetical protein
VAENKDPGPRLASGSAVTVRLVKAPRADKSYPALVLTDDGVRVVVRAPWTGPERDFGFVRFAPGDVLVEHYWRDRWYAVKEVRDATGALKGWYCDVTRPTQVRDGVLEVRDLELDLWVPADRSQAVRLDEDEFVASGLPERDPAAAKRARHALDELVALADAGFPGLALDPPPA